MPRQSKSDTLATMITNARAKADKIDSKGCLIRSLAAQSHIEGTYLMAQHVPVYDAADLE
jgi:hypothetical protein